ncbi:MAG TPA: hypothetical protein DC047_11595, partial [Blastocatellia bacterium]|nr:hypothetical protein [Blastocatellia bacterium]
EFAPPGQLRRYAARVTMDNEEATSVLGRELERYRAMPYAELIQLLDETNHIDATGSSGTDYQVDISVMWDDKSKGDLRIIGAVDDGGWRAFVPLTDSFIWRPDGTFVGE